MWRLAITLIILAVPFHVTSGAWAQDLCAQISCDCKSLSDKWIISECFDRERIIKRDCSASGHVVRLHCTWNGPNAQQTALLVNGDLISTVLENASDETLNRFRAISIAIQDDFLSAVRAEANSQFGNAVNMLKAIRLNLDNRLSLQQALAAQRKLNQDWAAFVTQAKPLVSRFSEFEEKLWHSYEAETDSKKTAVYGALASRMTLVSGVLLEQVAFAHEQQEYHQSAAESWKLAAEHSKQAALKLQNKSMEKLYHYLQVQSAQRLYRSAWQWSLARQKRHAEMVAAEAKKIFTAEDIPHTKEILTAKEAHSAEKRKVEDVAADSAADALAIDSENALDAEAEQESINSLARAKAWLNGGGTPVASQSEAGAPATAENNSNKRSDSAEKWNLPGRKKR